MSTTGHENEAINVQGLKASLQKFKDEYTTDVAYLEEGESSAVIADFDPQTDTVWKKAQTLSNAEKSQVKTNLGLPQEIYSKTEVNNLITTPNQQYVTVATYASLPASGSADTIYRVSNYNGSTNQVDATMYSEYAWNGSDYTFLCVKSQIGEVFDITAYNSNTKYADLAAALGTNGANIPESLRKGGMSVKYVSNSDNRYVQYRLMANAFTTNIVDWTNVDEQLNGVSSACISNGDTIFTLSQELGILSENQLTATRLIGMCVNGELVAIGESYTYGFRYIEVKAGKVYRVKGVYSVNVNNYYDGLIFSKAYPVSGNKADLILDGKVTEGERLDKIFAPVNDGYLLMFTYTEVASQWEFYEVDVDYNLIQNFNNLYNRDEQAFSSMVCDIEPIKEASNLYPNYITLSSAGFIGGFATNEGLFVLSDVSYGFKYIQVEKYKKYRVYGNYSVVSSGYAGIVFTENLPVSGSVGQVFDIVENGTYAFDKIISFAKDGYLLVWCGSSSSDAHFEECSLRENSGFSVELSIPGFVYKDGTIGQDGTGHYYMTDYIEIGQYEWLEAKTMANDYIANISFFDANKDFLADLHLENTDYYTWNINLQQPKYASAKYVIVGTLVTGSYTLEDFYVKLFKKDYSNKQNVIAKYNKMSNIGDSLTNSSNWSEIVCRLLDIPEYTHAGAHGLTMAKLHSQTGSIYESIQEMQADPDVDLITLWAGTNDFAYNITIGDFDEQLSAETRDVYTFYGAFIESVERLLQLFPKARIILIGTTDRVWRATGTSDPWHDGMTDLYGSGFLPDYVDAVKKVAEHYSLPFLDLLRTSGINKFNISNYMFLQTSGEMEYYLHFDEDGRYAIAKRIAAFINSVG